MTMKKILYAAFLLLTTTLLYSCQSEDLYSEPDSQTNKSGVAKAYLSVRLNLQNDAGTRGEDGGTTQGTDFEYSYTIHESDTITNARFFFYDESGNYITEAKIWDGYDRTKDSATGNVEKVGKTVLALDTLISRPAFVLTVLNYPEASFTPAATLSSMNSQYCWKIYNEYEDDNWAMVMSNSAYLDSERMPYFYGTRIAPEYYQSTAEDAEQVDPLDIYVERVGAKITVGKDFDRDWDAKDSAMHYNSGSTLVPLYKMENVKVIGDEDYTAYIGLYGWKPNATQPQALMFKHIDDGWSNEELGFNWNDPENHRSYWEYQYYNGRDIAGKFPYYYSTSQKTYLNYVTYHIHNTSNGCTYTPFDGEGTKYATDDGYYVPNYVFPQTNEANIQAKYFNSAVESVLILGRILYKSPTGGFHEDDLVRYKGHLYTEAAYKQMVADKLAEQGYKYYCIGTEQVDGGLLQITDTPYLNGRIMLKIADFYIKACGDSFFITDADGNEVTLDEVNAVYNSFNWKDENNDGINDIPDEEAIGYRYGAQYYNVPIQHFNNGETVYNEDGTIKSLPTAKYGVVRNHWYQISLKTLDHIGEGVWNQTEPIVPNPKDVYYHRIEATVNVMPWQSHTQTIIF